MAEVKVVLVSYTPPIVYIHCLPLTTLALETKGFPFMYIYAYSSMFGCCKFSCFYTKV